MMTSISAVKDVEEAYQQVLEVGAQIALTRIFGAEVDKALALADRVMETMDVAGKFTGIEGHLKKAASFTMGLATGWEARERYRAALKGAEYDVSEEEAIDPDTFKDEMAVLILRLNNWAGAMTHPFIPKEPDMKEEDLARTEKARQCMSDAAAGLLRAETVVFVRVVMLMPKEQHADLIKHGAMHYPDLHHVLKDLRKIMEEEQ